MRFILVNGRTPFGRFTCAKCGEAISNSYLREMTTHLYYCDQSCYSEHCVKAALNLKVAPVGLAPVRNKRSAVGDLTVST